MSHHVKQANVCKCDRQTDSGEEIPVCQSAYVDEVNTRAPYLVSSYIAPVQFLFADYV